MSGNDSAHPSFLFQEDELTALIAGELGCYGRLRPDVGPQRWLFSLSRRKGIALIRDGWIVIEFQPRGRPPAPQRLLERNLNLTGNAKYRLCDAGVVRLVAEIPVDGVPLHGLSGFGQHIREAVVGLAAALGAALPKLPEDITEVSDAHAVSVAELCTESGWAFDDRGDGQICVALECAGDAFYQASVELHPGRIVLGVTPFRGVAAPASESSRLAVAALFLSISGSVRMARAVAWPSDHGPVPGFQVDLPVTTSAAALGHGLASLSVACDEGGQEAIALADDSSLAEAYLEIRHPQLLTHVERSARSAPSGSKSSTTPH